MEDSRKGMWAFTFFAVAVVLWLFWRKRKFSILKESGIPGPEPNLLFGNLLELYSKDPIKCQKEWIQKFGKVVGYYYGTEPIVLITDVELLKTIQISYFHKFMNRPKLFVGLPVKPNKKQLEERPFSQNLITLRDKRWKDIRAILTPSFTASKMKQMAPIINDAVDSLINNVEKKSNAGESFDIYPMYQGLTMDVIGRTAFGIQTDVQNDPNDPFIRSARVLFSDDIRSVLAIIAASFRELDRLWFYVNRIRFMFKNKGKNPMTELLQSVKRVINLRRKSKESRRNDLLQLMIDAKTDDTSTVTTDDLTAKDNNDTTENQTTGLSSGKIIRQMTDAEIISNSLLFFLAGYETTSNALAFTTHFLLNYPEVQDKVREEVLQLLKSENELDYYSVNKLQYLDNVLHESLRLYPPVHLFVSRECGEDIQFDKILLKKGLAVQVPAFILHRDPELWEDPEKFKPERFAPENKEKLNPLAYQPFGAGPRNCVGMRFALMEAKLALARLLSKYKLKPCAETDSEPMTLTIRRNSIKPGKGVYLKAIPF